MAKNNKDYCVSRTELIKAVNLPVAIIDFAINVNKTQMRPEMKRRGNTFVYTPRAVDIIDEYTYDYIDNPDAKISFDEFLKGISLYWQDSIESTENLVPKLKSVIPSLRKNNNGVYYLKWKDVEPALIAIKENNINIWKPINDYPVPPEPIDYSATPKKLTPFEQVFGFKPVKPEEKTQTETKEKTTVDEEKKITEPAVTPAIEPKPKAKTTETKKAKMPPIKKEILNICKQPACVPANGESVSDIRKYLLNTRKMDPMEVAVMDDETAKKLYYAEKKYAKININGKAYLINTNWLSENIDVICEQICYDTDIEQRN